MNQYFSRVLIPVVTDPAPILAKYRVFRNVGQSIGSPIAGSILSTFTFIVVFSGQSFTLPTSAAFQYTYYIAAIAFAFGLVASLFAHEVMGKNAKSTEIQKG